MKQPIPLISVFKFTYKKISFTIKIVEERVVALNLDFSEKRNRLLNSTNALATLVQTEIVNYLDGQTTTLNFPVYLGPKTLFQQKVLAILKQVPYGSRISYQELAAQAGYPKAYRAVASVCAQNLLPLIYPCHRVVKNDGGLGSYRYTQELKVYLIALEQRWKR